jgi:hypothetical protein
MIFKRSNDNRKYEFARPLINETERRLASERVIHETETIFSVPEVQDSIELMQLTRLPNILKRIYVPSVENSVIASNTKRGFVPIVSMYPGENLSMDTVTVSLNSDISGFTTNKAPTIVGLNQIYSTQKSAPLTLIHEMTHVYQQENGVNPAAYERYPKLAESAAETEAYNVEAVIARALLKCRNPKWSHARELFNSRTEYIANQAPVFRTPFEF